MSFEVCVDWPENPEEAQRLVKKAYEAGYLGIAFNHVLDLVERCGRIRNNDKRNSDGSVLAALAKQGHISPIQYVNIPKSELHECRLRRGVRHPGGGCSPALGKNTFVPLALSCHNPQVNIKFGSEDDISLDFLQLRRLTVIFDSADHTPYINALSRGPCSEVTDSWSNALFSSAPNHHPYDLVAVSYTHLTLPTIYSV